MPVQRGAAVESLEAPSAPTAKSTAKQPAAEVVEKALLAGVIIRRQNGLLKGNIGLFKGLPQRGF